MSPPLKATSKTDEKGNERAGIASQALHADDHLNVTTDISPPLHVSTNFRYVSNPADLITARDIDRTSYAHIYSRDTAPNSTRLEAVLESLLHARCITYSTGLAALHALYSHLRPMRVAITGGYHGSHTVLSLHRRLAGTQTLPLNCPASDLGPGDVIHLETPLNPTGEAFDITLFAAKAHARGAYLLVDSTFAPPGLQDPFEFGADVVWHSGTKYIGGHSDLLCGVLASRNENWMEGLRSERTVLGSVMGSMEAWLAVRSLRTLSVRVQRQSASVGNLVAWLDNLVSNEGTGGEVGEMVRGVVARVQHSSLQRKDMRWLKKQMPNGFGPVFAIWTSTEEFARRLPSKLKLFQHATSLGGVESLIEWRAMSDHTVDRRLMRVSVGLEDWEDLRDDLVEGFKALREEELALKAKL